MYDETRTLKDRREMLKVKVKSLAEEARIIRREERKTRHGLRWELHDHRAGTLRAEARATHIAYAMIRGRTLYQIECCARLPRPATLWERVRAMIKKYGPTNPLLNATLLEACCDANDR